MQDIGSKIFEYRSQHKITQERFAEISGVSFVTINRAENSKIKLQAETYGKIMNVIEPKKVADDVC